MFKLTLDALPDGVLVVDSGRRVIYANAALARQWRFPDGVAAHWDEKALLAHASAQLVAPDAFLREVERLHASDETSKDELQFKDGRIFVRRSLPFVGEGTLQARIWIFTDVTEARSSLVDTLSGVANRRAFSRDFPRFVEEASPGLLKCVAILDIDNFKAYNDSYGHAGGDAVLRRIGAVLRARLEQSDEHVFRIGGEEFLVACHVRQERDAWQLLEGLREAIAAMAIPHGANPPHGVVTTSIGIGVFSDAQRPTDIFERVDGALYAAKAAGRNLVRQTTL